MHIIDLRDINVIPALGMVHSLLAEEHNVVTDVVEPSAFSFLTSMRLASRLKANPAIETIIASRSKDIVAALSARDLGYTFRLIYAPSVTSAEDVPISVVRKIREGVDCWVFASTEARDLYRGIRDMSMRDTVIIEPTTELTASKSVTIPPSDTIQLYCIGELANTTCLDNAIRAVARANTGGQFRLHICGTGSAGRVMPVVRAARRLETLDIFWHGEDYDTNEVIDDCDIALATSLEPSSLETAMQGAGIPLLKSADADTLADQLQHIAVSPTERLAILRENAIKKYNTVLSPRFHVEQWAQILRHHTP